MFSDFKVTAACQGLSGDNIVLLTDEAGQPFYSRGNGGSYSQPEPAQFLTEVNLAGTAIMLYSHNGQSSLELFTNDSAGKAQHFLSHDDGASWDLSR